MAAGSAEDLTLIHFGDLHLWRFGVDRDLFPKRLLGLSNLALRRRRAFPQAVAHALVEKLHGEQADYLLFTGDLSTTALADEFRRGRKLLEPLFERWGERLIAIPGNHDRYTPRAARLKLYEQLFLRRELTYPFVQDLNREWSVVGFDCSVPRLLSSRGRVTPEMLAAVRDGIVQARAAGRRVLVMGHYPAVYPPETPPSRDHSLGAAEREALARTLAEAGAEFFLHGHKHRRWALRVGDVVHLNCGAAGMMGNGPDRRPGYLKLVLRGGQAARIEAHWLAAFGVGGLTGGAQWQQSELEPVRLA